MSDDPSYRFTVPGDPVPWSKGAPPGKGPQVPDRQAAHAGRIRQEWREAHGDGWELLEKGRPVRVVGHFYVTRPKSHYGSGHSTKKLKGYDYAQPAPMFPTGKPDLSNLLKMVEDALTHQVWQDDDQVVDLSGSKRLINWWEPPRSIVTIIPLTPITYAEHMTEVLRDPA